MINDRWSGHAIQRQLRGEERVTQSSPGTLLRRTSDDDIFAHDLLTFHAAVGTELMLAGHLVEPAVKVVVAAGCQRQFASTAFALPAALYAAFDKLRDSHGIVLDVANRRFDLLSESLTLCLSTLVAILQIQEPDCRNRQQTGENLAGISYLQLS